MKRFLLISVMAMLTIASFGRKHVAENAVVVADTIYYADNMMNVANSEQASYYRLLQAPRTTTTARIRSSIRNGTRLFSTSWKNGRIQSFSFTGRTSATS